MTRNLIHRIYGFTLIEVMVAMALLTTGLLGYAHLQLVSVQFSQESQHRSQLLSIGNELMDQMRASQIEPGDPDGLDTAYTTTVDLGGADTPCDPTLITTRNFVVCFYQKVSTILPAGTASITTTDTNNDSNNESYLITVFWSDKGLSRQADMADSTYDDLGDNKSLGSPKDCNDAMNRSWSEDLDWPFENQPSDPTCLVSYSWVIEVYNSRNITTS